MTPLDGINSWIKYEIENRGHHADRPSRKHFAKFFWIARDCFEGNASWYKKEKIQQTYGFIVDNCANTPLKSIILEELKKHIGGEAS
jgi:hypothetical protein